MVRAGVILPEGTAEWDLSNAYIYFGSEAMKLKDNNKEIVMAFNSKYLKDTLDFIVCSDCDIIEVYYNGELNPLIMKSSRLYTAILPVRINNFNNN